MDRKSLEDADKKKKQAEEVARINALHEQHMEREKYLNQEQDEMKEILSRLDERLLMIEEQVMDIRKSQNRRWF